MVLTPVSPALGKLRQEEHRGFEARELPSETLSWKKTKTNPLPQFKAVCTKSSFLLKLRPTNIRADAHGIGNLRQEQASTRRVKRVTEELPWLPAKAVFLQQSPGWEGCAGSRVLHSTFTDCQVRWTARRAKSASAHAIWT